MFKRLFNIFRKKDKYDNFVINNKAVIIALEAETKRRLGDFNTAAELINTAIQMENDNDMYYATKSLIFFDEEKYNAALEEINKAIKINNKVQKYKELRQKIMQFLN